MPSVGTWWASQPSGSGCRWGRSRPSLASLALQQWRTWGFGHDICPFAVGPGPGRWAETRLAISKVGPVSLGAGRGHFKECRVLKECRVTVVANGTARRRRCGIDTKAAISRKSPALAIHEVTTTEHALQSSITTVAEAAAGHDSRAHRPPSRLGSRGSRSCGLGLDPIRPQAEARRVCRRQRWLLPAGPAGRCSPRRCSAVRMPNPDLCKS
jgi:hypothetical protein